MMYAIGQASFAIIASLFGSATADACDRADKLRSVEACAAVPGCSWCTATDLITDRPFCVSNIGASFVPKQLFTCAAPPKMVAAAALDDDCDDDDNDICDLHKRDQAGCMANPMCTWCVSSGLVPATPDCVLTTDAPFIPKQVGEHGGWAVSLSKVWCLFTISLVLTPPLPPICLFLELRFTPAPQRRRRRSLLRRTLAVMPWKMVLCNGMITVHARAVTTAAFKFVDRVRGRIS